MAGTHIGAAMRHLQKLFSTGVDSSIADDQLIQRFASTRDESAFETLLERHGPMVLSVCLSVLRNADDAQDAFQATFLILARKAGSVRAGASLGGWLYRVAFNMAVQMNADGARRREMERRAAETAGLTGREEVAGADLIPALYEEINRLPERFRMPIVLCHLEELTHAQAAERLGWTVGTVRGRVARARELLRGRLARRGLALSTAAMVAALTERAAKAAVPAAWVTATVNAAKAIVAGQVATAGAVSAALILSERVARAMYLTTLMQTVMLLLIAGGALGSISLVAVGVGHPVLTAVEQTPRGQGDGPTKSADPAPARAIPPTPPAPASAILGGRVLDPDGRPIEGASLHVWYFVTGESRFAEIRGACGPGARFEISVPRAAFQFLAEGQPAMAPAIVAIAKGFGPGVVQAGPAPNDLTIRLVKDNVPIDGRVLDLEGRPVQGALVKTTSVYQPPNDDLSVWLEDARARGSRGPWIGTESFPFEMTATTGPDGQFRLEGIGSERIAELLISGPRIATARLYAMTRAGQDVAAEDRSNGGPKPIIYHAARFEHVAEPAKRIVGMVRDLAEGRPLAGVRITGIVPNEEGDLNYRAGLSTTTDHEGRYQLAGLRTAGAYRVFVFPAKGQPYPNIHRDVTADRLNPDEVTCDISLKHGVLVRGRLTDKVTGQPIAGQVMTYSFADNPRVKDYPGFPGSDPPSDQVGADGRFEVVALPGRGLVVAGSFNRKYFSGSGAEAIEGLVKEPGAAPGGYFLTLPSKCSTSSFQAFAAIDPGKDDVSVNQDLRLDPGRSLKGTVLDPDGRPISGTIAAGLTAGWSWDESPRQSADFQVIGVPPGGSRRVYFLHHGRKLAGSLLIDGDEAGPIVVKLQPWGVVTGRIVTDDDRPPAKLAILGNYQRQTPAPDDGVFPKDIPIGIDGRFRIEGLVPGLQYEARVADRPRIVGSAFKGVRVGPGETKDLGDLKPSP